MLKFVNNNHRPLFKKKMYMHVPVMILLTRSIVLENLYVVATVVALLRSCAAAHTSTWLEVKHSVGAIFGGMIQAWHNHFPRTVSSQGKFPAQYVGASATRAADRSRASRAPVSFMVRSL
jgi:hypothetical protein